MPSDTMNEQIRAGVWPWVRWVHRWRRHLAQAGMLSMVWNRTGHRAEAVAKETGVRGGRRVLNSWQRTVMSS